MVKVTLEAHEEKNDTSSDGCCNKKIENLKPWQRRAFILNRRTAVVVTSAKAATMKYAEQRNMVAKGSNEEDVCNFALCTHVTRVKWT